MSDRDEFGYRRDPRVRELHGVQVAEGKHSETLQPIIVLYVREDEDGEQIGYALPVDIAEGLAGELARWVRRAREKHWE
jgi:hypothetical protein